MSRSRSTGGTVGIVVMALGLVALIAAALLVFSAGIRVAPAVTFGESMTVEIGDGDHAIYIAPSADWASVECTGSLPDGDLLLRPDMTQQGLLFPEQWEPRGSFHAETAGTTTITCDGAPADARFTVGPVVSFLDVVGQVLLGALGLGLVLVGVILRAVRPKHPSA